MPLTSTKSVSVGDIVMITGYGNDKFLVCRGWYTYDEQRHNGWYFKRIPEGTVVPDSEVSLDDVTVVSSDTGCSCGPSPCPPPSPEAPDYGPMGSLDGAFVTVDTIEERNKLCFPVPPDGKLVRVNNVDGKVKYYEWDAEHFVWNDFEFPTSVSVSERIASLDQRLIPIEKSYNWVYMKDLLSELGVTA